MIGTVAFFNHGRRFALLTPIGKSRSHDIFACDVWWHVGGLALPVIGDVVSFDVAKTTDGSIEAINISRLATTAASDAVGALLAVVSRATAAGDFLTSGGAHGS